MGDDLARDPALVNDAPAGHRPAGFDPARVALRMSREMKAAVLSPGPYVRSANGGVAKLLRELGLTRPHYTSPACHKPVLTPLGEAVRDYLGQDIRKSL